MKAALFLDDESYRHVSFLKAQKENYDTIHCVSFNEDAIDLLKKFEYDLVSLDYDLTQTEGEGKSTLPTAAFIACMEKKPRLVRVHSRNYLAAPKLWEFLINNGVNAYILEFGELEAYDKIENLVGEEGDRDGNGPVC